jgi:PIN domain nuclease of toxin-antitoxin system
MILDTHAWLWYVGKRRLARRALHAIEKARVAGRLQIAAVTLWEIALLVHERHVRLTMSPPEWFRDALSGTNARVVPLDPLIATSASRLIAILRDPADCQIVGTALEMGVPLATRDARILENAAAMGLEVVEV